MFHLLLPSQVFTKLRFPVYIFILDLFCVRYIIPISTLYNSSINCTVLSSLGHRLPSMCTFRRETQINSSDLLFLGNEMGPYPGYKYPFLVFVSALSSTVIIVIMPPRGDLLRSVLNIKNGVEIKSHCYIDSEGQIWCICSAH